MLRFTLIVALSLSAVAQNSKDAPPPPEKPAWHIPYRAGNLDCLGFLIRDLETKQPIGLHIGCSDLEAKRVLEPRELIFPEEFGKPITVKITHGDDTQTWTITKYVGPRIHWSIIGSGGTPANGDL